MPTASLTAPQVAGERGVRYATISHDARHAGRGGLGAVMGAKNLKAIAVRAAAKVATADPAAVQRILRHSDIRVTMDVYGHLALGYLRDEVNRLSFQPKTDGFTSPVLPSPGGGDLRLFSVRGG